MVLGGGSSVHSPTFAFVRPHQYMLGFYPTTCFTNVNFLGIRGIQNIFWIILDSFSNNVKMSTPTTQEEVKQELENYLDAKVLPF